MLLALIILSLAIVIVIFAWVRWGKAGSELERHSISAEELHSLMDSSQTVLVFDVRQPLDLLAYPEQIPGAQRIPPEEAVTNPRAIPKDKDVVVYCTCPGDKTSRMILRRARALGFSRIKFLVGGLAAWKDKGFPIEPYRGTITFSSAATAPRIT